MEEHKAVEVRVVRLEVIRFVHCVVVFDERGDLCVVAEAVLHDAPERVSCCPLRQRELGVPIGHAFRTDEDQMYMGAVEEVLELNPDVARQGRFSAGAEDENSNGRRTEFESFDIRSSTV